MKNFFILALSLTTTLSAKASIIECKIDNKGTFKLELNKLGFPVNLFEEINSSMTDAKRIITHEIKNNTNGVIFINLQDSNPYTGGQSIKIKTNPLVITYHEDDSDAEQNSYLVKCY